MPVESGDSEKEKMKMALLFVFLFACAGCCSDIGTKTTEKPIFTDGEAVAKTWTTPEGQVLRLLDSSVIDLNLRGKLLVKKYGDNNTGFVTCLDFYRVSTNSIGQNEFALLKHDYKPGMMVTSIKPVETQDRAAVFITRETIPGTATQHQGLRYTWRYEKDYTLTMDLEIGTWAIP
jgi:hypothetical protein